SQGPHVNALLGGARARSETVSPALTAAGHTGSHQVPQPGDESMIRTGAEYLESVRDGRRVLCEGELIDDITTHSKTQGYAHAIAEYYDLHHDPEFQEIT